MVGYKMVVIFNEESAAWEPGLCVLDIQPSANVIIIPGPEGPVRYMPADDNVVSPQYDKIKMRCDKARVGAIYKIESANSEPHCGAVFNGCGYSSYEISMLYNKCFYNVGHPRRIEALSVDSQLSRMRTILTQWLTSDLATIYRSGDFVIAPLDDTSELQCAPGIHFFRSEKAALDWCFNDFACFFLNVVNILNNLNYIPPRSHRCSHLYSYFFQVL